MAYRHFTAVFHPFCCSFFARSGLFSHRSVHFIDHFFQINFIYSFLVFAGNGEFGCVYVHKSTGGKRDLVHIVCVFDTLSHIIWQFYGEKNGRFYNIRAIHSSVHVCTFTYFYLHISCRRVCGGYTKGGALKPLNGAPCASTRKFTRCRWKAWFFVRSAQFLTACASQHLHVNQQ